jgi:hypothetical protein
MSSSAKTTKAQVSGYACGSATAGSNT